MSMLKLPNNLQQLRRCWKVNRKTNKVEQNSTSCFVFEDLGMDEEEDVIPLPNVNSAILKKVRTSSVVFILIFLEIDYLGYSMGNTS